MPCRKAGLEYVGVARRILVSSSCLGHIHRSEKSDVNIDEGVDASDHSP